MNVKIINKYYNNFNYLKFNLYKQPPSKDNLI